MSGWKTCLTLFEQKYSLKFHRDGCPNKLVASSEQNRNLVLGRVVNVVLFNFAIHCSAKIMTFFVHGLEFFFFVFFVLIIHTYRKLLMLDAC